MINGLEGSNPIQKHFFHAEITEKERVTIMPLTLMDTGVETTVKSIRGKDQTRKFLQNLGFVEGDVRALRIAETAGKNKKQ